jgi:hypothetical protein
MQANHFVVETAEASVRKIWDAEECRIQRHPEDVRSSLNWSAEKQFLFLVTVLSPLPMPIYVEEVIGDEEEEENRTEDENEDEEEDEEEARVHLCLLRSQNLHRTLPFLYGFDRRWRRKQKG